MPRGSVVPLIAAGLDLPGFSVLTAVRGLEHVAEYREFDVGQRKGFHRLTGDGLSCTTRAPQRQEPPGSARPPQGDALREHPVMQSRCYPTTAASRRRTFRTMDGRETPPLFVARPSSVRTRLKPALSTLHPQRTRV